jgi:hypothetical protein
MKGTNEVRARRGEFQACAEIETKPTTDFSKIRQQNQPPKRQLAGFWGSRPV